MDTVHDKLANAISSLKLANAVSFGNLLKAAGYRKRDSAAVATYDSYGPGPVKNSITLSHLGKVCVVYIMPLGTHVSMDKMPSENDAVVVVNEKVTSSICKGNDIFNDDVYKN